ncbi:MAG: phenylacetate-CoA oxygenase subunit PaaC [Proteobacteria bacterium]|nr:phenylacetate-CoA oxygenase subunit PaaC [Pseudomonadota bacterium]
MAVDARLADALLQLADSPLVLAQRLCEWIGKGPVLEEELASTNVGLDLLGQARLWLGYAGEVEARTGAPSRDEDALAFHRDQQEFRNVLLVEQPNGDYAMTLARQFWFDHAHRLLLDALTRSRDERIAAIAAKSVKEVAYHVQRVDDWIVRLGDGTDESHARMQRALDALWPYTGELFVDLPADAGLVADGVLPARAALRARWLAEVDAVLATATLTHPDTAFMHAGGREGRHTEHLGHLLAEMQFLPRAYPDARW